MKKKNILFIIYNDGKSTTWRTKHIKDTRNFFRLKRELNYTAVKEITNLFRLEKETRSIQDIILRDIQNIFEHEKENYYKPVRLNFWSNNYIKCEANDDWNKTLSVEECRIKIRPYLKDIISNLKKSHKWKIQLIMMYQIKL